MKRKMMNQLVEWKNQGSKRLPLILYGARQVGKTYLLTEFARNEYKDHIYINFEQMERVREIFEYDLIPDKIVLNLERYFKKKIIPEQTLLIFDEIQVCEKALTSLKYFAEQANEYHIVSAGSLLGVAINREKFSFPVGKVQMLNLYPLDFEEFLWEMGEEELANQIRESAETLRPLLFFEHDRALEYYRTYLCVGGMPACVREYSDSKDLLRIQEIQQNILNSYITDMDKYTSATESAKVRTAYQSIPAQLAKDNKKFQYKLLKTGASSYNFGTSIDWLNLAKIVLKCNKVENPVKPLEANILLNSFKLYMGDIGLLTYRAKIDPNDILMESKDIDQFKGALVENYVAEGLLQNRYDLYYWESDGKAEIDFVILKDNKVIPLEVKSSENTRSKSLTTYMQKYNPEYAIRLSTKNFGFDGKIKAFPLYALFTL